MRETRTSGSEGEVGLIAPSLPLSKKAVGDMSPLFQLGPIGFVVAFVIVVDLCGIIRGVRLIRK